MKANRTTPVAHSLEFWVACGMTIFLLVCHVIRLLSAGGLYRDEVNSVYLATEVSVRENFDLLRHDSCPVVWFMLLRLWHAIGLGQTDFGWRLLGFFVGVSLLALIWVAGNSLTARRNHGVPTAALFLIGFCPAVLTVGDSLRAYGIGMACCIGAILVTWHAIRKPCFGRWAMTAAVYCLAVHAAFHNAVAVFAVGVAAACVGALRRSPRQIFMPLVTGAIAAATLAIYVPSFRFIDEWAYLLKQPLTVGILLSRWAESLHVVGYAQASDGLRMTMPQRCAAATIWIGFLMVAVVLIARALPKLHTHRVEGRPMGDGDGATDWIDTIEAAVFIGCGLLAYVPGHLFVVYTRGWMPAPKYYVIAIAFTATFIDWALRLGSARAPGVRRAIAITTAILGAVTSQSVLGGAFTRWTNMDLAARVINERFKDGDLVIVQPWELGVSFSRYCRPGITWMTLPELADNTIHRYDLYRKVIMDPSAGTEMCRAVRRMSVNGGDVWYVGSELTYASESASLSGSQTSLLGISCLDGAFRESEQLPPLTTQVVAPHENVTIIHFRR